MSGFPKLPKLSNSGSSQQEQNERRKEWQVLYRLEGATLLVQSGIKPNWSQLPTGYHPDQKIRELDFQTLEIGKFLKFRLVANPIRQHTLERKDENGNTLTIQKPDGSEKPRYKTQRRLITKEAEQIQWLADRLKGAALEECYVASPQKIYRGDKAASIFIVQFDGVMQVIDPCELQKMIRQGIGRGRAYGCGLLSIAKCHSLHH